MKIPKSFMLGGTEIKVSRDRKYIRMHDGIEGFYESDKSLIWVHPDASNETEVFLHEFFHACCDLCAVNQAESWSDDLEEIICQKFSEYIRPFIK